MTLPASVTRWTPKKKRDLVDAVTRGEISLADALRQYGISADEFGEWQRGQVKAKEVVR